MSFNPNIKSDGAIGHLQTPANMESVTPSDTVDLPNPGVLYISGAGDVKFITVGGQTQTLTIAAATFLPIQVARVYATLTTATGIKVCF